MESLFRLYAKFNIGLRTYLPQISFAIIATILIIYGNNINRFFKKILKHYNFFIRILGFIIVCSFVYGAMTLIGVNILRNLLYKIDRNMLAPVLFLALIFIGILADRKKQI